MPGAESGRSAFSGAALAVLALAASSAFSLSACSLSGYATQSEASEEEMPSAVFTDYAHTVVERSRKLLELKADRAELYETSKKTILTGVVFSEYDPDTGEVVSKGRADRTIYHNDTKDAEFSGNVKLESKKQDAILQGEYLSWIDKDKRLEGGLDRTVTIGRSDGSSVSGAGFEAWARKRAFSFRGSVEGRIESKSKVVPEASQ
jgi:LPS export ABC transporter protein LptC